MAVQALPQLRLDERAAEMKVVLSGLVREVFGDPCSTTAGVVGRTSPAAGWWTGCSAGDGAWHPTDPQVAIPVQPA
jgi:hypothetical protein